MKVAALRIGAEPGPWRELGFVVDDDGSVRLEGVRLELQPEARPGSIASWTIEGDDVPASIDGLPAARGSRWESERSAASHPNTAVAVDHVVVLTPSLDRTTAAFAEVGIECRRVREAGGGVRQGFFLVGDLLVEVVEGTELEPEAPASFWGITMVVSDIDHAAELLGDRLGRVKDAIQPGRRIATVRPQASGGLPLALITPRH